MQGRDKLLSDGAIIIIMIAIMLLLCLKRLYMVLPKRILYKGYTNPTPKKTGKRKQLLKRAKSSGNKTYKTMVILGSGGHTSEMLSLLTNLNVKTYKPLIFVASKTDKFSEKRLHAWEQQRCGSNDASEPHHVHYISRSREVNQSFVTTIFTTLVSLFECLTLIWNTKPDVILCDGPGTCLPPCYICFFFNFLNVTNTKIIFVESFARVKSLSLTGKLLIFIANRFIVQWKEALDVEFLGKNKSLGNYWNCEYIGIVI